VWFYLLVAVIIRLHRKYRKSNRYEILLDDIAAIMEFEGSPIILEVLTNGENLYISSISEVVKIHEQGAKRRQDAETELVKVEQELKQALLAAGSK